ncbi:MAG: ABC transporter substrate-binding protein [Serpentinimonas sp.]|nr:ABC transporter substrate-binding protein [Serpentinimonas sp.]MDO9611579.1 ABC transporter substrate-binding protein [Serpentinimonas sp.]
MKKILTVAALAASLAFAAHAQTPAPAAAAATPNPVRLGVLLGFTGPIESLTPAMAASAEMAIREVNASGLFLRGTRVEAVRADSTCVDAAAATAAAQRLITAERVSAIIGADCSGATTAVLQNVAVPRGVLMISPSSTSPALTTVRDNDLFFRTAPSDARQGEVIAELLRERGITRAAMTFTNNDYGRGLSSHIRSNFERLGGRITISAAHEDGKGDYTAEVAALAAAGGEILIVAGYVDQGGRGIIRSALDSGAFTRFFLPDGMIGDSLAPAIGPGLNGSFGTKPGADSPGGARFEQLARAANIRIGPYTYESYDAAALILLAMQAANSTDSARVKEHIMAIANGPGETINAGDLARGLRILAAGGRINYEGASAVRLVAPGEAAGAFRLIEVRNGRMETTGFR